MTTLNEPLGSELRIFLRSWCSIWMFSGEPFSVSERVNWSTAYSCISMPYMSARTPFLYQSIGMIPQPQPRSQHLSFFLGAEKSARRMASVPNPCAGEQISDMSFPSVSMNSFSLRISFMLSRFDMYFTTVSYFSIKQKTRQWETESFVALIQADGEK